MPKRARVVVSTADFRAFVTEKIALRLIIVIIHDVYGCPAVVYWCAAVIKQPLSMAKQGTPFGPLFERTLDTISSEILGFYYAKTEC